MTFDDRAGTTFSGLSVNGFGAGVAFNVLYNPHDVTLQVAAVPEAETWVMMLAGLGLVGFVARRRNTLAGQGCAA
ncbi:MAG: PEP-CTERM sorting domain-containing protein [Gammaproteobacteria bacterium]